jgi:hypothetical protein
VGEIMAMYCPQCSTTYEQRLQCPACGVRLIVPEAQRRGLKFFARGWQHTPTGRILVGLLLAQGLFYGMRHLLTGVLLVTRGADGVPDALASLPGLIVVQVMQVIALILGGLLTGAGQRKSLTLGGLLGLSNGACAVIAQQWPATASHSLVPIYCQPLLHAFVGAVGAWCGSVIWKPLNLGVDSDQAVKRRAPVSRRIPLFAGKTHWLRIGFGTLFSVGGCLSATLLLESVTMASNDALMTETDWQEKVVTWEIKALAMFLGGVLSGAFTVNGFKQGLIVGLASGAAMNVVFATRGATFEVAGLMLISTVSLSIAGGWFGGTLFPPAIGFPRPRGMGPASI